MPTRPLWQQQQQPTSSQQPSKDSISEKSLDAFKSGIKDGSSVAQLIIALQSHDTYAVRKALQQLQVRMPTPLHLDCVATYSGVHLQQITD
jgi:hypothetical protein